MSDLDHARELLALARRDLQAMRGMLDDAGRFFADAIFGFHAQQAVEKAMRAEAAGCGIYYPLTHQLKPLHQALGDL